MQESSNSRPLAASQSNLEGAPFLGDKNAGLYEPDGSKSLGEATERSSKHNGRDGTRRPRCTGPGTSKRNSERRS